MKSELINMKPTALLVLLLATLILPAQAAEPATADWPSYFDPFGTHAVPSDGLRLISDVSKARRVWKSEEDKIGHGKSALSGRKDPKSVLPAMGAATCAS